MGASSPSVPGLSPARRPVSKGRVVEQLRVELERVCEERDELLAERDELVEQRDVAEWRLYLVISVLIDRAIEDERGGPVRRVVRDLDGLGL